MVPRNTVVVYLSLHHVVAKRIAASPPESSFAGYNLQFSTVKESCVSTSAVLPPLSEPNMEEDTVKVEGLSDVNPADKEKALHKALQQKNLPQPTKLYIGEEAVYLQFSSNKGIVLACVHDDCNNGKSLKESCICEMIVMHHIFGGCFLMMVYTNPYTVESGC